VSASGTAALGRARAESLMTSACTVFTPGAPITDPNTGEVTGRRPTVWFGPVPGAPGRPAVEPADDRRRRGVRLRLPRVGPVRGHQLVIEGHRLTVTASPDPALVGLTVEIQKVDRGDNITARRLACSEVR
jgi:hypothetical protein